jgi:succinate dehydrogenase/fumarate reductase flavoprotein subunit
MSARGARPVRTRRVPPGQTAPDAAWDQPWDVAVVGGGNAALVNALTAADNGARVLLLERAPAVFRGGNSRHTRNVRCAHEAADGYVTGPYPSAELRRDLDGVGTGPSNEALADLTIAESRSVPGWMSAHGARWQPALRGTLGLARTNRFFLGGGKALVNSYYRTAQRAGITVRQADCAFTAVPLVLAASGLLTLAVRDTAAFGTVLAAHLTAIMAGFAIAPYTKFAHWVYRLLAIYKHNLDALSR